MIAALNGSDTENQFYVGCRWLSGVTLSDRGIGNTDKDVTTLVKAKAQLDMINKNYGEEKKAGSDFNDFLTAWVELRRYGQSD